MMLVGGKHFLSVFLHKDGPWGCAPKGTYYPPGCSVGSWRGGGGGGCFMW